MTTTWKFHNDSPLKGCGPRDFKKLNKMSLKEGNVTARDQYKFRAVSDARIPIGVREVKPIMLPEKSFTYGRSNKPATPVTSVLSNYYGEAAGLHKQEVYR